MAGQAHGLQSFVDIAAPLEDEAAELHFRQTDSRHEGGFGPALVGAAGGGVVVGQEGRDEASVVDPSTAAISR